MKRKTDNFSKFYNKKNNAAIKEAFRQEKKAAKKERKEAIERHFEEKRKAREAQFAAGRERSSVAAHKGAASTKPVASTPKGAAPQDPNLLPLNKYIAHGGICSRRDAAELIRQGKVEVNGKLVTEPGTKVSPTDFVKVNGKKITISRNFVYILLNKPKDYITTTDDPQGRKTVLDLIRQATTERVYPVGRLDRNTSGVLLLTNDGDLSQKLAHPSHEIKKIYHVTLDKPLTKADFDKIVTGVQLEDGLAHVDVLAYADAKDKAQIGLEIHSGRNRIVRRIFEHLGYDVRGLDRVMYAGLTKKNVQRGHWRLLTEKEVRILKYLNASFRGSLSAPKAGTATNVPRDEAPDNAPKVPNPNKAKASHAHTGTGYQKPKASHDGTAYGPRKPRPSAPGARKPKPGASASGSSGKPFREKSSAPGARKPRPDSSFAGARKSAAPSKPGQRKPFVDRSPGPSKPEPAGRSKPRSSGPSNPAPSARRGPSPEPKRSHRPR